MNTSVVSTTSLKVGDIIFAYAPGFHIIEKFETRTNKLAFGGSVQVDLVFYRKIADKDGKPHKTKQVKCCHPNFCKKVDCADIQKLIDQKNEEIKELRKFALSNLIS
jgi:hypothetical protein